MNTKRMRSRYHRSGNSNSRHQNGQIPLNRNHVFDSNGPDVRIRGTAQQLFEKYLQYGRDAISSGDRIAGESFFQYAEHYSRILNMMNQSNSQPRHRPAPSAVFVENTPENLSQPSVEIESGEENLEEEKEIIPPTLPTKPPRRGRIMRPVEEVSDKE